MVGDEQEQSQLQDTVSQPKKRGRKAREEARRASGQAATWNKDHKGSSAHDRIGQHSDHAPKAGSRRSKRIKQGKKKPNIKRFFKNT